MRYKLFDNILLVAIAAWQLAILATLATPVVNAMGSAGNAQESAHVGR